MKTSKRTPDAVSSLQEKRPPKSFSLTAFERCMLALERSGHPSVCFARVCFDGKIDRTAFEYAVLRALEDHWLFRATLTTGWSQRWRIGPTELPPIEWVDGPTRGEMPPGRPIDLTVETGLRLIVVQDESGADVNVQFHHACSDGLGSQRFFEDVMCHYAAYQSGESARSQDGVSKPIVATVADRVLSRGRYDLTLVRALVAMPKQVVGLLGALQYWSRKPASIRSPACAGDSTESDCHYPAHIELRLTAAETLSIRETARKLGVSQGELVIREFFRSLWRWQRELGNHDPNTWIRLMIPINMRGASYRVLPALNSVSSVFLDRRADDHEDAAGLLTSICDELQVIAKYELRYTFLISLWLMKWIPGMIRKSTQRDECDISAVLTNTGRAFRRCPLPRSNGLIQAGNLTMVDCSGLSPIRLHTWASVLTHEYENRFKVDMHFDPRVIRPGHARKLIELFRDELTAGSADQANRSS